MRGKPMRTTVSDKPRLSADHVNRQFQAPRPNALWVSDFTYVATWARLRLRRLRHRHITREGSSAGAPQRTAHAGFVLDALEQALMCERRPFAAASCITRSRRAHSPKYNNCVVNVVPYTSPTIAIAF